MKNQITRLHAIIEASKKLTSTLNIDELLEIILEVATSELEAERGTVFLVRENGEEIYSRILKGGEVEEISLALGQGIAGTVARMGKAIRIDDPYSDSRFNPETDHRTGFKTRNILCLPIQKRDKILGVIQLLNSLNNHFTDEDEAFLDALASHMAIAIENAMALKREIEQERTRREIELAARIQTSLLPPSCPRFPHLKLEKIYRPCHSVGGDLYGFFELSNGNPGVLIADVSGKSIPAAMITSSLFAFWKAMVSEPFELRSFCEKLNDLLADTIPDSAFVTMIFLEFDMDRKVLNYCNCGHNPALLLSEGTTTQLNNTGTMLGMFPHFNYRTERIPLKEGDRILIYTDGLSEASYTEDDEIYEFGLERIQRVMKRPGSLSRMLEEMEQEVFAFSGSTDLADDMTLIAMEIE